MVTRCQCTCVQYTVLHVVYIYSIQCTSKLLLHTQPVYNVLLLQLVFLISAYSWSFGVVMWEIGSYGMYVCTYVSRPDDITGHL